MMMFVGLLAVSCFWWSWLLICLSPHTIAWLRSTSAARRRSATSMCISSTATT